MPEYEVNLYYTGFITRTVRSENEEEAIQMARTEQDNPCNQDTFMSSFEPILETLEPWKDCDTARLKALITFHPYPKNGRCPECGEIIYREGGCPICISCGWSPCG